MDDNLLSNGRADTDDTRQREREQQYRLREIRLAMASLTANLIRIVRGAGEPHSIVQQIVDIDGLFRKAPPGLKVWQVNEAVREELNLRGRDQDEDYPFDEFEYRIRAIEEGSLRAVAARLLRQQAQTARGRADLWDAYYSLERHREHLREINQPKVVAPRKLGETRKRRAKLPTPPPKAKPQKRVQQSGGTGSRIAEIEKLPGESTFDFMKRCRRMMAPNG